MRKIIGQVIPDIAQKYAVRFGGFQPDDIGCKTASRHQAERKLFGQAGDLSGILLIGFGQKQCKLGGSLHRIQVFVLSGAQILFTAFDGFQHGLFDFLRI